MKKIKDFGNFSLITSAITIIPKIIYFACGEAEFQGGGLVPTVGNSRWGCLLWVYVGAGI